MILDPASGHRLLFIEVDELLPASGRIHLDLAPNDRRRDDEIERIIAMGALEVADDRAHRNSPGVLGRSGEIHLSVITDRRNPDGTGWMVLADPEGNHFCIVRSDEERAETS